MTIAADLSPSSTSPLDAALVARHRVLAERRRVLPIGPLPGSAHRYAQVMTAGLTLLPRTPFLTWRGRGAPPPAPRG